MASALVEASQPSGEAATHQRDVLMLRMANALVPIGRLPPETLIHIFLCYQLVHQYPGHGDFIPEAAISISESSHYKWVPGVTHICHHWREVALEAPLLWTDVFITSGSCVDRLQTFLMRSKHAPLQLSITEMETWTAAFEEAIPGLHDTEVLKLSLPEPLLGRIVSELPVDPPLRSMVIHCPGFQLPLPQLSIGGCTSLQNLYIMNYYVQWSRVVFPRSLTRLVVDHPFNSVLSGTSQASPCADVVAALSHLCALEHLDLHNVLPPLPESLASLPPVTSTIILPRLKYLSLSGSTLASAHFLDHCVFPGSTSINFPTCPDIDIPLLVGPLSRKLAATLSDDLVAMLGMTNNTFSCYNTVQLTPRLTLSLPLTANPRLVVEELCARLPLGNVRVVALYNISFEAEMRPAWERFLRVMPDVLALSLGLGVRGLGGIFDLLQPRVGDSDGSESSQQRCLLPRLAIVSLGQVRFKDTKSRDDLTMATEMSKTFHSRAAIGPKAHFKIRHCTNFDEKDLAVLQAAVTVDWDGLVRYEDAGDGESIEQACRG